LIKTPSLPSARNCFMPIMPSVCSFNGADTTGTSHSASSLSSSVVSPVHSKPHDGTRPEPVTADARQPKVRNTFHAHRPMCPKPTNPTRASPSVPACGIEASCTDVDHTP